MTETEKSYKSILDTSPLKSILSSADEYKPNVNPFKMNVASPERNSGGQSHTPQFLPSAPSSTVGDQTQELDEHQTVHSAVIRSYNMTLDAIDNVKFLQKQHDEFCVQQCETNQKALNLEI